MSVPAGTRLGPYEIRSPLGVGGMGEVYRAKDTRLDRTVAIKVLPANLAGNPDARQRFEREARAVSSLNHPHICVLHDVGCQDGIDYLVMEYLEGETLATRLSKGPMDIQQALHVAIRIADALSAAHRAGILHRDLKPGNVMVTRSGAKLMDFGLAKLRISDAVHSVAGNSLLATVSQSLTKEGTVVGTFPYMAPEQLQGKETDARADIFAFGAMLYEMLTGRKAFEGETQASVIGNILHATPTPLPDLQPLTPPALHRLVNACLVKDPEERWQTAHDLKLELQWIEAGAERAGATGPKKRERALWLATTVLLLVVAAAAWVTARRSAVAEPLRLTVAPPPGEALVFSTNQGGLAISPDGRTLAFVATSQGTPVLWLRGMDSLVAKPLAGSEGAYYPFWSPDSRSVGFFAAGKLKKTEVRGGLPQTLADAPEGRGGTWNRDGVIVFSPGFSTLYRVSAAGGTPVQLTTLDASRQESEHSWPSFLPDGRHFLYLAQSSETQAIFVASVDGPDAQKPVRIVAANSNAVYAAPHDGRPGYLVFAVDRMLTAQRFDTGSLRVEGDPISLAEEAGYLANIRLEDLAVSETGMLVYGAKRSLPQVTWIGRDGKPLGVLGAPGDFHFLSLSPDDKRVAVVAVEAGGAVSMWTVDASRGTSSRFSVDIIDSLAPRWSPDSRQIAFSHVETTPEKFNIFRQTVSGATAAERLTRSDNLQILNDWSGDGRFLLYSEQDPKTRGDLWVLPLSGERKPFPYLATPFNEKNGRFAPSPDGAAPHWLAYASDETGVDEVYVQSFPAPGTKVRISSNGGVQPRWRRDGKELFFVAADGSIMAAPVIMTASSFEAGALIALCKPPQAPLPAIFASVFEVSADGRRFLVLAPSSSDAPVINVIANWNPGLNR
jgi:Tol biopolymer transport system component